MTPRIETLSQKKLVGCRRTMSLATYSIGELWQTFLPRRREIVGSLSTDLISLVVYKPDHFADFKPTNEFERWAAVEVANFDHVPPEMETFVLPGGRYAVFDYKGLHTDHAIYQYIFETWLPASGFVLANRPHFEVLGAKYKNNDPASEEEIWIPIQTR
jgi:AraC family transcriptional regulator